MTYKQQSLQPILDVFVWDELLSPTQISQMLWKNKWLIHKYLKALISSGKLKKVWLWTHAQYQRIDSIAEKERIAPLLLPFSQAQIIQETFYKFADNGKLLEWVEGFAERCHIRWLDAVQKAEQFCKIKQHLDTIKNDCGLLDATQAFAQHVETLYLDKALYIDQYKWMEFGRGKLAEMTFYAKQSQNIKLINQCLDMILLQLQCVIHNEWIDAIAITPRSITRNNQLLHILKNRLKKLWLPFVSLSKYFPNQIPVPQKSLKTREQRIRNATDTIIVDDVYAKEYKRVLLIDDFVGSWSTLNIAAKKLKDAGVQEVIGCAFVGNADLKYEVINEV